MTQSYVGKRTLSKGIGGVIRRFAYSSFKFYAFGCRGRVSRRTAPGRHIFLRGSDDAGCRGSCGEGVGGSRLLFASNKRRRSAAARPIGRSMAERIPAICERRRSYVGCGSSHRLWVASRKWCALVGRIARTRFPRLVRFCADCTGVSRGVGAGNRVRRPPWGQSNCRISLKCSNLACRRPGTLCS
jgi:hypothetical protein